jgi:hypothetical protein
LKSGSICIRMQIYFSLLFVYFVFKLAAGQLQPTECALNAFVQGLDARQQLGEHLVL